MSANDLSNIIENAGEAFLRVKRRKPGLVPLINHDFERVAVRPGHTVNFKFPVSLSSRAFTPGVTTVDAPGITPTTIALEINLNRGVPLRLTSADLQNTSPEFWNAQFEGLPKPLDADIESEVYRNVVRGCFQRISGGANLSGSAGVNAINSASAVLEQNEYEPEDLMLLVSPASYANLRLDSRFIDASAFGSAAPVQQGVLGTILGIPIMKSQHVPDITTRTIPAGFLNTGSFATATAGTKTVAMAASGTAAGTVGSGSVFTTGGQTFVVTVDAVIASNSASLSVEPAVDDAIVVASVVWDSDVDFEANLLFVKDALGIGMRLSNTIADRVQVLSDPNFGLFTLSEFNEYGLRVLEAGAAYAATYLRTDGMVLIKG